MKAIILIISLTFLAGQLFSQNYVLDKETSELSILGTSNIHDWESDVKSFEAEAQFDGEVIRSIKFSAKVKSIKSGKFGMDKNTYNALKADDYPKIVFESDLISIGNKAVGKGRLTIAGKTNYIHIGLSIKNDDKKVITGEIRLKMTDYGIKPPVALFGMIKTGDEIIIKINFTLNNI